MKREEFLRQLEYLLQDISEEDKRDAIDYYRDYLEEAGPEREEAVLTEFGSPERIAAMIRTDLLGGMDGAGEFTDNGYDDQRFRTSSYPVAKNERERKYENYDSKHYEDGSYAAKSRNEKKEDGKWWKYLLIALGILFAGPFVLAAVFGAAGTATGFIIVLAVSLLVLALLTIAGILGGISLVIAGAIQLFGSFWGGVMSIGLGLVFIGAGCLLLCCSWLFYGKFLPWAVMAIVNLVKKLFHKGEKKRDS